MIRTCRARRRAPDRPAPLTGGPLALLRFAREHNMLRWGYVLLIARWLWLKLRWRGRLRTDGLCFVCPGVKFEIGRDAQVDARPLVAGSATAARSARTRE